MKLFLLFFVLLFTSLSAWSQTDKSIKPEDIPAVITDFLNTRYPGHSKVKYYEETIHDTLYYEADFELEEKEYSVMFRHSGAWYETEIELPFKQVSDSIQKKIEQRIQADYTNYKIMVTQEADVQGVLLYELEVKGKKNNTSLFTEYFFDRQGNFVRTESIELKAIPSLF